MFVLPSPGRGLVDIQGVCNLLLKDGRFSKQQTTVDELKDAFNVFDKSGDGMVSVQDLRYVRHRLGSNQQKVVDIIRTSTTEIHVMGVMTSRFLPDCR